MDYKLEDLIYISLFQNFQDRLNEIYPFPSIMPIDTRFDFCSIM
jgi:hypothetical protein